MNFPNVAFIRTELANVIEQYNLIRDCIAGETAIKAAGEIYLPMPESDKKSCPKVGKSVLERYKSYKKRAVFYNVTRRTLFGLIGQVFMRDPEIKIPAAMEVIRVDATGAGVSLDQVAKKALGLNIAYSRGGLFTDYPDTEEGATKADLEAGNIRPTINVYGPLNIINWRVREVGAKEMLSLVVLYEGYPSQYDGFEIKLSPQFRVLRLLGDDKNLYYQVELYREEHPSPYDENKIKKTNYILSRKFIPKGPDGLPLTQIPFYFFGAENNDANVDNPNMYDLASINVAHYRNSADYEESCYIVGQPTPVVSGLTQDWLDDVLGGVISFGSRGGIPLPTGASADLLQAQENTMIKEAMEIKERQMVALGAKLVEQKEVQRTAYETKVEATSEGSILANCSVNVSSAIEMALKACAMFMGLPEDGISYQLNKDFDISRMTPEEQSKFVDAWQKGAITFTEMRAGLRKGGMATEKDELAAAEIQKAQAEEMAKAIEQELALNGNTNAE
jgi:hypothetical protein